MSEVDRATPELTDGKAENVERMRAHLAAMFAGAASEEHSTPVERSTS